VENKTAEWLLSQLTPEGTFAISPPRNQDRP
jgi:hypothetical protein